MFIRLCATSLEFRTIKYIYHCDTLESAFVSIIVQSYKFRIADLKYGFGQENLRGYLACHYHHVRFVDYLFKKTVGSKCWHINNVVKSKSRCDIDTCAKFSV